MKTGINRLAEISISSASTKGVPVFTVAHKVSEVFLSFETTQSEYVVIAGESKSNTPFLGLISKRELLKYATGNTDSDSYVSSLVEPSGFSTRQNLLLDSDEPILTSLRLFSTAYIDPVRNTSSYLEAIAIINRKTGHYEVVTPAQIFPLLLKIDLSYYVFNWMTPFAPPKYQLDVVFESTKLSEILAFISLTGRRSIPVIRKLENPSVIGLITDELVFNYLATLSEDKRDKVTAKSILSFQPNQGRFITPCLKLISENQPDTINSFFDKKTGSFTNSLLVVNNRSEKKLVGILSYVDLFHAILGSL